MNANYKKNFFNNDLFGPCLVHIRAMFWQFLQNICLWMPEMAQNFSEESCMLNRKILVNVVLLGPYYGHVLQNFVQCILWNCVVIFCDLVSNLRPLVLFNREYICDEY